MDLIAALGLVLIIEGMVLIVLAGSMPALLAVLAEMGPLRLRWAGLISVATGVIVYLLVRDAAALGL